MGSDNVMIRVKSVTHVYEGTEASAGVKVLEGIDLEIRRGEFVSLVGASGCGKTTLLNMFAGLVEPSSGSVSINDAAVRCPAPNVSYMAARDSLLPWRTARKNVEFALEAGGKMDKKQRRERASEMLTMVGLGDFQNHYPRQLSHGMRQRTNLARTLASDPEVLLMDEPFGALDAQTKTTLHMELLSILESAPLSERKTVVFVTHDLQEALLLSDRVVVMHPRPGRIATDQAVDLPRPRSAHLRETMFNPEFKHLHETLFTQLEGDMNVGAGSSRNDDK
ncbi:ABC transporter ATP-binding protein [Nocardia abscessus]|uniref:ABC transporter ATP-binding protein n=1 Tax=Nocardia abscessus TaxID=120957 RepID=UPI002457059D|nr:ABC transporter ATP-binding protein [Nocardia abscessus]